MAVTRVYSPRQAKAFLLRSGGSPIESPTFTYRKTVTAAQIKAMNGAAVNVLPAPGTGWAILMRRIVLIMTRTGTAYANGGVVSFQYTTTTTSVPHTGSMAASVVTTGGAGVAVIALGPDVGTSGLVIPSNEGVDITNGTAPFITGTGTLDVIFEYSLVKVG